MNLLNINVLMWETRMNSKREKLIEKLLDIYVINKDRGSQLVERIRFLESDFKILRLYELSGPELRMMLSSMLILTRMKIGLRETILYQNSSFEHVRQLSGNMARALIALNPNADISDLLCDLERHDNDQVRILVKELKNIVLVEKRELLPEDKELLALFKESEQGL